MSQYSLVTFMNEIDTMEKSFNDNLPSGLENLRVYPWQPPSVQLPCVFNGVDDSPHEVTAVGRDTDSFTLMIHICIRHTDVPEDMRRLTAYADVARVVMDQEFSRSRKLGDGGPLNGAAREVVRRGMRLRPVEINNIKTLAFVFPVVAKLDRLVT